MDKRKNYYLVLDVETANSTEQALTYDIGFAICDKQGNIYLKRSYAVSDIFFDEKKIFGNMELMNTAYYAEKLPQYYEGMHTGVWQVSPLLVIRKEIHAIMKEWNVRAVCAYNASFDTNALNITTRYVTKSFLRWFFPFGTDVYCIWNMACQVLATQKTFQKIALREDWISEKGNLQTSAEVMWRYLSGEYEFEEKHTGLADVEIECKIMAKCFSQHKAMNKNINRWCWRIPQSSFKALKEEEL